MYRLFERINRLAIAHPWLCIATWLMLMSAAMVGMPNIVVDASYRAFFDQQDPLLKRMDEIQAEFSSGDSLVFMLAAREGDMFTPRTLQALEQVTEQAWTLPEAIRVNALGNFPYSRSVNDDLYVDELIEDVTRLDAQAIANIRHYALSEPLLRDRLLSRDGQATLVYVTFTDRTSISLSVNQQIYHAALQIRDQLRSDYPELEVYVTGIVAGNAAFTDVASRDAQRLIPLGLLCALLVMLAYMRYESGRWGAAGSTTFAALTVIIVSVNIPMGLMGWFGLAANNMTSVIPVVILTLAVADSLHILLSYFDLSREGHASEDALLRSLKLNAEPVWLTSFTTMIGFLALNNSDSPAFQQLGNLVAVGVFIAWLAANTLLPALISLMPSTLEQKQRGPRQAMPALSAWLIRQHRKVLIIGFACLIGGAVCIPLNQLNDAWSTYLSQRTTFGADTSRFIDKFEDLNQIEFVLDTGRENGIYDPAFLTTLGKFAEWARQQPEVRFVQSIDLTIKRLNRNMHGDDPAYSVIPQDPAETAQYLLLYEMSLPYGASITDELNLDKSAARVVVALKRSDTAFHLGMQHKLQDWLKTNAPELWHPGTSTETIMANLSYRDAHGMLWGTAMALLAITLTLTLVFRSLRYGLLSLLVNAMPAVITLGLWGLLVGQAGISVSMVFAASLGIVVDYSVHFISKYRQAKQNRGLKAEAAIEYAFSTVGVALLVTTGVLVVNFLLLGLSDFALNVYMGVLTAMTIVLALLSQLFFLPSLLLGFGRKAAAQPETLMESAEG